MYMLYRNYYVESLLSVLKRYSAPVTFKVKVDALIGEKYDEISTAIAIDDNFKEIENTVVAFVEIHLIPIYATDVKVKLTDIDLNHDNDKIITLSAESPYLITLAYDINKGVKTECGSDDHAAIVGSIIKFLDIDVSADDYISEKSFLEFDNVEITVYENDDELKVVDLTKTAKCDNAVAVSGGVANE